MYAPGVNTLSAWIGHPWASAIQSGTSTAAPYVAGIAAYNLGEWAAFVVIAQSFLTHRWSSPHSSQGQALQREPSHPHSPEA